VDHDRLETGRSVKYGLDSHATDGQWHTFRRDLEADLHNAQPDVDFLEVNGFSIRGDGCVDDFKLIGGNAP
jgi:hypothetical protein